MLTLLPWASLTNWSVHFALENSFSYDPSYSLRPIGSFLLRSRNEIAVQDDTTYQRLTVRWYSQGIVLRDMAKGQDIGTKRQFQVKTGQFVLSRIDARHGAMGMVPPEFDGAIITNDFPAYDLDLTIINPRFFVLITSTAAFMRFCQNCSTGTTNRQRLDEELFLNVAVPIPPLAEQVRLAAEHDRQMREAEQKRAEAVVTKQRQQITLYDQLGIELQSPRVKRNGFFFIDYKELVAWGLDKNGVVVKTRSTKWPVVNLETHPVLYEAVYRGKSPVYANEDPAARILNQKCVRWNSIDTQYAKTVSRQWLAGLDAGMKTQVGDILVNSTGEGTIGRAAVVENEAVNLAFDSHVLLFRPDSSQLNAFLFAEIINSPYGQRQIEDLKSGQTTNQTELGVGNLKKILFPLPDFSTQQVIVKELRLLQEQEQALLTQADTLEAAAKAAFEAAIFA